MRGKQVGMFKLIPSLFGSLSVTGVTACGNSIDSRGFKGLLATLVCGAAASSSGLCSGLVEVKIQEAETLGAAGASWTDITDGVINGSFKFSTAMITASGPTLYIKDMYERLDSDSRKRYLRAHATITATSGIGIRYTCNLILCDPEDTLYAVQPTSYATSNAEFTYNVG